MEGVRGRESATVLSQMLCPLSYTDPKSVTGFEPATFRSQ